MSVMQKVLISVLVVVAVVVWPWWLLRPPRRDEGDPPDFGTGG
jgi:hypothetical protein